MLGSSLCELCLSFRQIQSCVAPSSLELTKIRLPLSPESWDLSTCHHSLAFSGLDLYSSDKFYLFKHKQNITTNVFLIGQEVGVNEALNDNLHPSVIVSKQLDVKRRPD